VRLGRERARAAAQTRVLQVVRGDLGDVREVLAQRRQAQRHDVQAVVELGLQPTRAHALREVLDARRDDAHVGAAQRAARLLVLAALEQARQRRLRLGAQRADVVEQQRAALRLAEARGELLGTAAERAAVDAHQQAPRALALVVDRARAELLAGAGLAGDQHRAVGRGEARELLAQAAQRGRAAHQRLGAPQAGDRAAQLLQLALQQVVLDRALHDAHELLGLHRLLQEVEGAGLHGLHRLGYRADAGDHHDRNAHTAPARLVEQREPVAARHAQVGHDRLALALLEEAHGLLRARGGAGGEALGAQDLLQRVAHEGFVVDDQDMGGFHQLVSGRLRGSRTTKRAPPSGRFSALIVPPWARTIP
jgi:hypothetical protein